MRRAAVIPLLLLAGCIVSSADSGVLNKWRDESLPAFERGKTTQSEVATALGPPSQLINLGDELIFYYLAERSRSRGVILIVYNTTSERVSYDRAIFFFDNEGVLKDFALSLEKTPYVPPEEPEPKESG